MSSVEDSIEILRDLIAFETISPDSNLAMIDYLADRLDGIGARIEVFKDETGKKANLYASIGPEVGGGILLAGHTDVVPVAEQDWTTDPFEMIEAEGRLFGRGTCDMKGFIAAVMAAAPALATRATERPIQFAFTYDEETGCIGARHLVAELAQREVRPGLAIIGEPTDMRVIEGHKGCFEYTTHFHGREGHGSLPDLGVSAVEYATLYASQLLQLRGDLKDRVPENSRFNPPHSTINIGALIGGVAHNVIPGKAKVEWEMRPVQESDAEHVKETLTRYTEETLLPAMQAIWPDSSIETQVMGEVAGLEPMAENAARDLVCRLTGGNSADVVSFGTEAGLFQSLGMSAVVCGPGSIEQAHKPDEYLEVSQLAQCVEMLDKLLR